MKQTTHLCALLWVLVGMLSIPFSKAEDFFSCDNDYYGTKEVRCQEIIDGREGGDAWFALDSADLCLMHSDQNGFYFKGHIRGRYVGAERSEDAIFPDRDPSVSGVHQYVYSDAIEENHSSVLFNQSDARWDGGLIAVEQEEDDGSHGYYHPYRNRVEIDRNAGTAIVSLERDYGWLFISNWKTVYSAKLRCFAL